MDNNNPINVIPPQPQNQTPEVLNVTDDSTNQAAPQVKRKKHLALIVSIVFFIVVAIIVAVILLIANVNKKISIDVVRNYCNKYNLEVSDKSENDNEILRCFNYNTSLPNSRDSKVTEIQFIQTKNGEKSAREAVTALMNLMLSADETAGVVLLEDSEDYKKYYMSPKDYSISGYFIANDETYIAIAGEDSVIRAALIEIGYPDRNWH